VLTACNSSASGGSEATSEDTGSTSTAASSDPPTQASTADLDTTDAPTTNAPTTDAPTTDAPTTDAPTTGDTTSGNTTNGEMPDACADVVQQPGSITDIPWPAAMNVGHDSIAGQTVRFHWTGVHNVLQVATFEGQLPPTPKYGDAGWPEQIRSGDKQDGGVFEWHTGSYPCGYRPGIYFFVDQDDPAGGVVSVPVTVPEFDNDHYEPRPCTVLTDPLVYGGRYAKYADRPGCTVFEVNNFQTVAHYDWVDPVILAKQGDLILFRWTGEHNIVQVHDVLQDELVPGGLTSGPKTNCVGGPNYSCANGPPELGEYLVDTTDHRPGIVHISDECAYKCTGHETGMNMQFDVRFPVPHNTPLPPVPGSCCAIDPTRGADCRVVEIYNGNDGAQLDYNVPIGAHDLVRFRWAGSLRIYQSLLDGNGAPTTTAKPGGIAMDTAVECIPGPNMTCLQGTTDQAQLVFDVAAELADNNFEPGKFGERFFAFAAEGENTPGFTSADSKTLLYVDDSVPYNPANPCP
jgi:hypothetical protein